MGIVFSKVTSKSQTVIPNEVRKQLGVKPGDRLRYEITGKTITISKAAAAVEDNPFAVFSEWASDADEEAFGKL